MHRSLYLVPTRVIDALSSCWNSIGSKYHYKLNTHVCHPKIGESILGAPNNYEKKLAHSQGAKYPSQILGGEI